MKKRLLILGGTSISRQIVYAARELDMEVFVTDYLEDSPCKKLADKSFMTSCTDIDAVVELIHREHIDGVIMGYADVLLPYYVQICEKAEIPCYANLHAINITTDKAKFKDLCKEYQVPVVEEYSKEDVETGNIQYPIIIKPVDNSGARGIFICHNKDEFTQYYPESLSWSRSKHVIIERYMTAPEATIFYYLHKGEIYNLGVSDRHMLKYCDNLLQLPVGYTFPSTNSHEFLREEGEHIKNMFRSLKMEEGMVFMQSFYENGAYIIYEMGYRLTGSIEHHLMEKAYKFNHLKAILNYAVGNKVDVNPLKNPNLGKAILGNVTLLLSPGIIDHYDGIEACKKLPGVLHIHESYSSGKLIDDSVMGKLAQVGIRVLIYAENRAQLHDRMEAVKDCIRVISTNGTDMIMRNYSYKNL